MNASEEKEHEMRKRPAVWRCEIALALLFVLCTGAGREVYGAQENIFQQIWEAAGQLLNIEPSEVRKLREQELIMTDEGHQEYYFSLLDEEEQRGYRQMLEGIRARSEAFYLTISDDTSVDRVYHAVLKDHPELYWAHNYESVYKTTYRNADYCTFAPAYLYNQEEMDQINLSMEQCFGEIQAQIPEGADDYDKALIVYTYLIDNTEYVSTEHDQSIAGVFWKKEAVCAGYAGAFQYVMERLGIPCIYVDGEAVGSGDGHAWNMISLEGQYYYVDVTNGDQPEFLEGDAVQLAEHKTTIIDYFCPFPWEYEANYVASGEFALPECTSVDMNFYVRNQGCFDSYDRQTLYDYCVMRLNNSAAVVRFKFSNQEAYEAAYNEWILGDAARDVAGYYLQLYGLGQVEYHYGVLQDLLTFYYMF